MFLRLVQRALMVAAFAAASAVAAAPSAAGTSATPAQVDCKLGAEVIIFSTDNAVRGVGTVTCSQRVFHIDVAVVLTRDNRIVGRDETVCAGQAQCRAEAASPNLPGTQVWCAQSTGHYALSPTGPIIDLGTARVCRLA